jgi:hypothetical protein
LQRFKGYRRRGTTQGTSGGKGRTDGYESEMPGIDGGEGQGSGGVGGCGEDTEKRIEKEK